MSTTVSFSLYTYIFAATTVGLDSANPSVFSNIKASTVPSNTIRFFLPVVASFLAHTKILVPRLKNGFHIGPWTPKALTRLGVTTGAFGGVALLAAVFFAEGVPRVRKDILQKIPVFGSYWIREIPPSDNVCVPIFYYIPEFDLHS
ncbi:hypothetical protein ABW20_dc0101098 [Dactylellina cionopaga]|nr:hypothetical protein ABW20_dc0101098 [Dactylellina cionopaga]